MLGHNSERLTRIWTKLGVHSAPDFPKLPVQSRASTNSQQLRKTRKTRRRKIRKIEFSCPKNILKHVFRHFSDACGPILMLL